jgi:putative salt-induced outer membrane protein
VSSYDLTANRYEGGASLGFKLDERSYVVGALRYENDDFSPFDYQAVVSIGYGYTALKNDTDELSFEIGPGYKRARAVDTLVTSGDPPVTSVIRHDSDGDVVGRGLIAYKHDFTDTTSLVDTLLIEAGQDNTFLQNDAGLQVAMSKKLALKVGYQVRRNSDVAPGLESTDQLITTNLVYSFGK